MTTPTPPGWITVVTGWGRLTLREAQSILRQQLGNGASRWVADEVGIAARTARRWLSPSAPRSRHGDVIELALSLVGAQGAAAARLRGLATNGGTISVGTVPVAYEDRDQGDRHIGDITVDTWMADEILAAANALDRGDLTTAADAFSNAVISGYSHGLEDTLTVAEWGDVQLG
jgi:hypothetical protein